MQAKLLAEVVQRRRGLSELCLIAGLLLPALAGTVEAQVKPYFLVVMDTSGSMAWCAGGENDCSCHTGNDCSNVIPANRCGFPSNRLGDAKCALQRIIDGVGGDAVFALMQFEHPCTSGCMNITAGAGADCTAGTNYDDGQLLTVFDPNNAGNANVREWVDGVCTGTCTGDFTRELAAGWWTPIARSLRRANQFLRGTPQAGFLFPTNGNVAPASPLANDSQLACRPVSVILLTDGDNNCEGTPATEAAALNTGSLTGATPAAKAFRTYVIGFGTGGNFDPAVLNNVALSGGTNAPEPNPDPDPSSDQRFYSAADEEELSVALADIVARSLPIEVCNGRDDDCDTRVDEGLPIGQPGSAAQAQALFCDREGRRSSTQNTQVRARPDFANDLAQSTPISQNVVCGHVDDTCSKPNQDSDCDGKLDEDSPNLTKCGTCPGQTDVCDGIDNDCDGVLDETPDSMRPFSVCPITCTMDVPCGGGVGECAPGHFDCNNGVLNTSACMGQIGPRPEICDRLDNDCNGVVDDPSVLARPCSTPWGETGICAPGTQYCARAGETAEPGSGYRVDASGDPVCVGQVAPADREYCDNLDHDCDGDPFTCTQSTCVVGPEPVGVGDPCGQGIGACVGELICNTQSTPPGLICDAVGGSPEICDGLDNDCDGAADENLGQGPCGSSVGECRPGNYACESDGTQACVGSIEPADEVCDGLDNDCDGKVDEELGLGDDCGSDQGECKPGKLTCVAGRMVCSGEMGPQLETCDCKDNDCDGETDEGTAGNPVCPGDSVCTMCQCALPCVDPQEFTAQCPQGKAAVHEDDTCFCVGELCNQERCAQSTIAQSGTIQCAPGSDQVGACLCRNNECVFACAGVSCSDGLVCDPTDGRCRLSSCLLPQFACAVGQRCGLVDDAFRCVDDPCAFQVCGAEEACRNGTCVKSCANIECESGQRCVDGLCEVARCASVTCGRSEQLCDPETGSCVARGACYRGGCADGRTCDIASGACREDVCLQTQCPTAEQCNSLTGQCERRCAREHVFCDGQCIDPRSNRRYCGASGACTGDDAGESCGSGLVCSVGQCSSHCAEGLLDCAGECVDPQTDASRCGASGDCRGDEAGERCTERELCVAGVCRLREDQFQPAVEPGHGIVATGGGGCACSVGPGSATGAPQSGGRLGFACSILLLVLGLRRRRGRPVLLRQQRLGLLLLLPLAGSSLLSSGCKLNTFCLDCPTPDASMRSARDSGLGPRDLGPNAQTEAGVEPGDAGGDPELGAAAGPFDASVVRADACSPYELCNGVDDDCDGIADEGVDPVASNIDIETDLEHCGGCGQACAIEHAWSQCSGGQCGIDRSRGDNGCDIGFQDLDADEANGCEYHCVKTASDDSACNLVDNDCDGLIDEDIDPATDRDNCGSCGLRCTFANAEEGATCVDRTCVLDASRCDPGFLDADGRPSTGCEYRCPVQPAIAEKCNAIDDDCDGQIDEDVATTDDARIGVACGSMLGECRPGTTRCVLGAPDCVGDVTPVPESCDAENNDCDADTDEGFDLQTDLGNCGSCGSACMFNVPDGHATLVCATGRCRVGACIGNWANENRDYRDGCEKSCTITGQEYCDGVDNDCNGLVDDAFTRPSFVCVSRETGVCAVNADTLDTLRRLGPQCASGTLSCNPANAAAMIADFEAVETTCDALDNDCDGRIDEMTAAIGQPCSRGQGACRTTGVNVCDSGPSGYRCGAPPPLTGSAETCDGVDNDCNGRIDDFAMPTGNTITGLRVVNLGSGQNNALIMAYEASRPDADDEGAGRLTHKPCSAPERLPWADVTWGEANAACCALNTDGECSSDDKGWRLCDVSTWEAACRGSSGACTWGYSNAASAPCAHSATDLAYVDVCLGAEDAADCPQGVSHCATATGSDDYSDCHSVFSGASIFDLSGNLKEWTHSRVVAATMSTPASYAIRGGSYSNLEPGRACRFDFTVGDTAFRFPTTGFRCCYYP